MTQLYTNIVSVTPKHIVDSTDIALALYPLQSNVGSTFSIDIPTNGKLTLDTFKGRILNDASPTSHIVSFGIRIGSTNYWFGYINNNGVSSPLAGLSGGTTSAAYNEIYGNLSTTAIAGSQGGLIIDIAALSVPTGSQTVQLIAAYQVSATTIKGTVLQTQISISIIDFSPRG